MPLERLRDHWNREVVWRQPSLGRAEFELRRGPLTFARMEGPVGARAEAKVELYEREMAIARAGLWSPRVFVDDRRRNERVANAERVAGNLYDVELLASGRRYRLRTGWGPRRVEAADGLVLAELLPKWRLFRLEADLRLAEPAAALDELPLLVALQWYLHVALVRAVTPLAGGF